MPKNTRLESLDVFRGLTIAGMVLVNNPGSWSHIYWPLEHAEWNGWTPTDLIFPFFLFIVGVAIPFSLSKRAQSANKLHLLGGILFCALCIFLLGSLLQATPFRMDKLPVGFFLLLSLRSITWIYTLFAIFAILYPY